MKWFWLAWAVLVLMAQSALASSFEITPFSRDKVIFDLGAALERDTAQIPISGTAPPGAAIEVRVVNQRTAAPGPWIRAGRADASGHWQVVLRHQDPVDWYGIEAKTGAIQVKSPTRFAAGDVVGILGQSELERLWTSFHNRREAEPHPPVAGDQVQFTLQNSRQGIRHMFAGKAATHPMRSLAAFWIANAPPGRKLHIVDLAQSGTARTHLQNDADPKRNWADLAATVAFAEQDGAPIGLVLESWFAGDRGAGLNWAERFMPLYTGTFLSGRDFPRGARDAKGVPVDHFLWDVSAGREGLFDVGETALGVFGPHRFDSNRPLAGATLRPNGRIDHGLRNIERARIGVADFLGRPQLREIRVRPALPLPMDYANGYVDPQTGKIKDNSHPSVQTKDGAQRLAKHVANAALVALGHLRYSIPRLDQVTWDASAVYLGSSTGPITTARQARAMPPLGARHPHWTDVFGFEINGHAAHRAELTRDGRIKLSPPAGRPFRAGDVIAFGMGGGGGMMQPADDWRAAAYLNYPIVDMGLNGLEGVAIVPGAAVTLGR